jgi:glutathione S-transferase
MSTDLQPASVDVFGLPPIWGVPAPSPFTLKLLTWLRMAGVPHRAVTLTRPPASATGKIPYVQLADGRILHDSTLIIEALTAERGVDLDGGLTSLQHATGHAVTRMIEDHLYFCCLSERWISDAGYACTSRDYFAHLPPPLRWLMPVILRRRIRAYLHGQGLGRHPPETAVRFGCDDLRALSAILAGQAFLLGRPSSYDAVVFGFLWAISAHPFPSRLTEAVRGDTGLVSYRDRVRARWWSDWPDRH